MSSYMIINILLAISNIVFYSTQTIIVSKIAGLLSNTTLFVLCLVDIGILDVFSVLTDRITPGKIKYWTWFVAGLYSVTSIELVIVLFYDWWPDWLSIWINVGALVLAVFTVLYDNIQGYFLLYLVFLKKNTQNSNITAQVRKTLKKAVLINLGLLLFDWATAILYIYITFVNSQDLDIKFTVLSIIESNIGFHGVFLISVVRNLKELAFTGRRASRKYQVPNHDAVVSKTAAADLISATVRN
ncbi:hypothetical protein HDV04_004816 [Boothiomyces sp. JEL0838]|nr:hypothetical protein HDV04_004816 [Boothiomyces sp. JEL0838]